MKRRDFLNVATDLVVSTLGAERVEILELGPGGRGLELEASSGAESASRGATLSAIVSAQYRAILSASGKMLFTNPWRSDSAASTAQTALKAIASAISFHGKATGILAASTRKAGGFTREDGMFLASATRVIESYLGRIRHHETERDFYEVLHVTQERLKDHQRLRAALEVQNRALQARNDALRQEIRERWRAENDLRLLVEATAVASEARDLPAMLSASLERTRDPRRGLGGGRQRQLGVGSGYFRHAGPAAATGRPDRGSHRPPHGHAGDCDSTAAESCPRLSRDSRRTAR